jgi:beta-fructofuranosidase
MALHLADRWIWDFWLTTAGGKHHVFYLQAPKAIHDPGLRHFNVSIGHAVSDDLHVWQVLPDAFGPGPEGSFDDIATWTGSVIEHEGRWHMLYTAAGSAENGQVQRVGLATSDDLVTWRKHDGPVIEASPRWYELLDTSVWPDQAWRDPWLFRHDGAFHVYLTARARAGDPTGRGVIAHASSPDLVDWEVLPPVTQPMGFGQMEVPQLLSLDDDWYMLFASDTQTQGDARRHGGTGTGTYYLRSDNPLGPFVLTGSGVLQADEVGSTYAGKVVDGPGGPQFLAWHQMDGEGRFVGSLTDPMPVKVTTDGALEVTS